MKKLCFIVMLSLSSVIVCHGGTVQWGVASWGQDSEYVLSILTSVPFFPPHYISSDFRTRVISTPGQASFENFRQFVWGGDCAFLQVNHGMPIDHGLFANNTDKWLPYYDYVDGWPYFVRPFIDPNNLVIPKTDEGFSNTVILAFAFYSLVFSGYTTDYYGWIEFGYNGTDVFIVNSALETTGLGIFAGTGNVVPEPSSVLLALSGFSLLLLRRRRITH